MNGPTDRELQAALGKLERIQELLDEEEAAPAAPPDLDPDAPATRHMHLVWNAWELDQLRQLARREALTMTKLVRRLVRERLLREAKL